MKILVKKWGNSASVRIPASIMQAAHLALDRAVDVREEDGRVVIEPIWSDGYSLDALVDDITSDNLHAPVDFGRIKGREVW